MVAPVQGQVIGSGVPLLPPQSHVAVPSSPVATYFAMSPSLAPSIVQTVAGRQWSEFAASAAGATPRRSGHPMLKAALAISGGAAVLFRSASAKADMWATDLDISSSSFNLGHSLLIVAGSILAVALLCRYVERRSPSQMTPPRVVTVQRDDKA